MSAACAGFPARMRESSIRLCQAHLDLTADAAAEAFIAATASSLALTAATAAPPNATQPTTSSSSNLSSSKSRAAPRRGLETGAKRGSRADISGELKTEKMESPDTNACNNSSRDSEGRGSSGRSRGSSNSSSAIGAVVRAACLVAAQGLMDPNKEVRLAGEDLTRSALSLWSLVPAAAGEEAGGEDDAETGAARATVQPSNATAKNGCASDGGTSITGNGGTIGNAAVSSGSVGSDDDARMDTVGKREAASEKEGTDGLPTKAAQNDFSRADSQREGQDSSARSPVNGSATSIAVPKTRAAVPLRDLRWSLELVLACVAPFLEHGAALPEENGNGTMPTNGGTATRPVGNDSNRRSTSASIDGRTETGSSPDDNFAGDPLDGAAVGEGGSSGGGSDRNDTEEREDLARPAGNSYLVEEGGGDGHGDAGRSNLALRVVEFACQHPDIGPALVSSVLVGWVPCLVQWGCNTPSSAPAVQNHAKVGHASVPRSPRRAGFTAGEAAASQALASGAIGMIVYMVRNFPLLPLSDFSAERLVAAAEGGMAFADGGGNGRRRDGVERRRDGEAAGGYCGAGVAARGEEGKGRGGGGLSRSQRSSTNGGALKAGEALMLELFLRTSGRAHGGRDLGLECLDSLLPALNTARGISCLDGAAATTADLLLSERRTADDVKNRSRTGAGEGGAQGKSRLEKGRNSCGDHPGIRVSSSKARECGERTTQWPSQRRHFVSKVEVRQRLQLPPAPPAANPLLAGRRLSSSAVSNGSSAVALENGTAAVSGVHPSASSGKSAPASVPSKGGDRAAAAPGGTRGRGDSNNSSVSSLSHGSFSSTSEENRSKGEGGGSVDSTATAQGLAQENHTTTTAVKQTAAADSNKNSKRVFPILSFGNKKSNDVQQPARNVVDDKASAGNAKAAARGEKPAGTPADQAKTKKSGGGFMSKLFRRGKK